MTTTRQKIYENVILYLTHNLGGEIRGKKKLAKLLYFVDFDFFEKKERSITGDVYKALPMGPFPIRMEVVIQHLINQRKLEFNSVKDRPDYNPTEVYKNLIEADNSVFDVEERAMLDRVILKYGHLNGKQLEDLTHKEAPYIGTSLNQEIAYELSFYRGTDFSNSA